jgi:HEXXH motif-containing protein
MHYLHHTLQSAMRARCIETVKYTLSQILEESAVHEHASDVVTVTSLGTADWERFAQVEGTKLSSLEQKQNDTPCPVSAQDLARCERHIFEVLEVVAIVDGEIYAEILEHVDEIKLFNSTVTQGFSDTRTMGAVFIRPPHPSSNTLLYFYEQLIHEMSHLQLHCVLSVDPLISGDRYRLATSPIRSDPRPLFGVLHATYVSAKLANAFFGLYQHNNDQATLGYLAQILDELVAGIDSLKESLLTPSGQALVDSMTHLGLRIARDQAWSSFDLCKPRLHRRTRKWVTHGGLSRLRSN